MKLSLGTSVFVPPKSSDHEVVQHNGSLTRYAWLLPAVVNQISERQVVVHWQRPLQTISREIALR